MKIKKYITQHEHKCTFLDTQSIFQTPFWNWNTLDKEIRLEFGITLNKNILNCSIHYLGDKNNQNSNLMKILMIFLSNIYFLYLFGICILHLLFYE